MSPYYKQVAIAKSTGLSSYGCNEKNCSILDFKLSNTCIIVPITQKMGRGTALFQLCTIIKMDPSCSCQVIKCLPHLFGSLFNDSGFTVNTINISAES